jgi:metal-responsive CopG/Arc/MetJ family transcriptional regulator
LPQLTSVTVRLPVSLLTRAEEVAEERGQTVSELVRTALQSVLELDPATRRHEAMVYEVAKTRSVLTRLLESQLKKAQVEYLLTLAEADAVAYVSPQKGKA